MIYTFWRLVRHHCNHYLLVVLFLLRLYNTKLAEQKSILMYIYRVNDNIKDKKHMKIHNRIV